MPDMMCQLLQGGRSLAALVHVGVAPTLPHMHHAIMMHANLQQHICTAHMHASSIQFLMHACGLISFTCEKFRSTVALLSALCGNLSQICFTQQPELTKQGGLALG